MKHDASGTHVYETGTVISWSGTSMRIHDPDCAVATAWGSITAPFRELAAVYDLHEGYSKGVMDSTSTGTYAENGWRQYQPPGQYFDEPCTYLELDHGAFDDAWMFTQLPLQPNPPTITLPPGNPLYVEIGPGPGGASDFKSVLVLGVDPTTHVSGTTSLFTKLAIQGLNHGGYIGAGKWYRFNNNQNPHRCHATQSGTWATAASGTGPTTFTTSPHANLTEYMVGWTLQPDINTAVYLTITAVSGSTLNVAGAYASLGVQGKRFRIYAPPGVERFGKAAGTLDRYVAANSSRHLYMGYRYESPAAGVYDYINGTALKRQTGSNFTGLYYTLHRHYDPVLMRFTSPDPAASPFYNLHAYCDNNPAAFFDPDGLWYLGDWVRKGWEWADDTVAGGSGVLTGVGQFIGGAVDFVTLSFTAHAQVVGWGLGGPAPDPVNAITAHWNNFHARMDLYADQGLWNSYFLATQLGIYDQIGVTPGIEAWVGFDTVTGESLTSKGRNARITTTILTVASIFLPFAKSRGGPKPALKPAPAPKPVGPMNWKGQPVNIPRGHKLSPLDPPIGERPHLKQGPFSSTERQGFLGGNSGGTKLAPHHRHQLPVRHGGVIDELYGPNHPRGNNHTKGTPSRHPNRRTLFGPGERARDIRNHWKDKGRRLIQDEDGSWYDPGP